MHPSPSLADLQHWMRWALTHPLGVARATAGEALSGLPPRFDAPERSALRWIAGDGLRGRTVLDRLAVYGSGYFSRLHGTLELEYPRLARALGEDGFRTLVAAHLLRMPSSSPSLADLGENLASTLRALPAASSAPWLVDLALVERAMAEVWLSGPGGPASAGIDPGEDAALVRLTLAPAARLLRLEWDMTAWEPGCGEPGRDPGWLVLWRVEASTAAERLGPASGAVLEAVANGRTLGEACEIADVLGLTPAEVTGAFGHWSARGWLVRAQAPDGG